MLVHIAVEADARNRIRHVAETYAINTISVLAISPSFFILEKITNNMGTENFCNEFECKIIIFFSDLLELISGAQNLNGKI